MGLDRDVRVGMEMNDGALLAWLIEKGYTVFGIQPTSAQRSREIYRPSGGKDDPVDTFVLAEVVRLSSDCLRSGGQIWGVGDNVMVACDFFRRTIWTPFGKRVARLSAWPVSRSNKSIAGRSVSHKPSDGTTFWLTPGFGACHCGPFKELVRHNRRFCIE